MKTTDNHTPDDPLEAWLARKRRIQAPQGFAEQVMSRLTAGPAVQAKPRLGLHQLETGLKPPSSWPPSSEVWAAMP